MSHDRDQIARLKDEVKKLQGIVHNLRVANSIDGISSAEEIVRLRNGIKASKKEYNDLLVEFDAEKSEKKREIDKLKKEKNELVDCISKEKISFLAAIKRLNKENDKLKKEKEDFLLLSKKRSEEKKKEKALDIDPILDENEALKRKVKSVEAKYKSEVSILKHENAILKADLRRKEYGNHQR